MRFQRLLAVIEPTLATGPGAVPVSAASDCVLRRARLLADASGRTLEIERLETVRFARPATRVADPTECHPDVPRQQSGGLVPTVLAARGLLARDYLIVTDRQCFARFAPHLLSELDGAEPCWWLASAAEWPLQPLVAVVLSTASDSRESEWRSTPAARLVAVAVRVAQLLCGRLLIVRQLLSDRDPAVATVHADDFGADPVVRSALQQTDYRTIPGGVRIELGTGSLNAVWKHLTDTHRVNVCVASGTSLPESVGYVGVPPGESPDNTPLSDPDWVLVPAAGGPEVTA